MQKIVIAVTGASGSVYAKVLLTKLIELKEHYSEISVVVTENARQVWQKEIGDDSYKSFDVQYFDKNDFNAPFASGSGKYDTMVIIPCSMGTLGRIAGGISNDLITRAADVMLKEKRTLICVVRETPYNLIHIRNMETVLLSGGIICPATPSFYSNPKTIEELAATVVDRVLDLAGLPVNTFRWGSPPEV